MAAEDAGMVSGGGGGPGPGPGGFGDSYDYLFKFLVIGSAGTGKSCLLHQGGITKTKSMKLRPECFVCCSEIACNLDKFNVTFPGNIFF